MCVCVRVCVTVLMWGSSFVCGGGGGGGGGGEGRGGGLIFSPNK